MKRFLHLIVCFLILGLSQTTNSADPDRGQVGTVPIHYDAWDLPAVVNAIGRATGHTFIFGDDLKGRVSVTVPYRVTPGEALELLNAMLFIRGFSSIPIEEGISKIVKISEVSSSAPLDKGSMELTSSRPVTTLVALENVSAESVVTALAPLTSKNSVVLAYPPTNSIVLAGSEGQVARLMTLSRLLDRSVNEDILVRSLRYRDAQTIAEILDEVVQGWGPAAASVRIWPDNRSNQIILHADKSQLGELTELITELDEPIEGEGGVQVIRVVNRDAQEIADQLTAMGAPPKTAPQVQGNQESDLGRTLVDRSFTVTADEATQSLILVADSDTMWTLKQVIAALDRMPPRVEVDVVVMEVRKPSSFALGFDFFLPVLAPSKITDPVIFIASGADVSGFLENPLNGLDTGVPSSKSPDSTFFGRYARDPIQIPLTQGGLPAASIAIPRDQVAVQAEDVDVETKILIRPHLVALSGEEHEIFAGENIPIPVSSASGATGNSGLSTTQNIERTDVGVNLKVKPVVGEDGDVKVGIDLRLSQLAAPAAGSVEDVGPTLLMREIQTELSLDEGRIAIIGGLIDEKEDELGYGIPYLRDIPGLGYLFGGIKTTKYDLSILMIVSANVMKSMDEQLADSIRRQLGLQRSLTRGRSIRNTESEGFALLLDTVNSQSKANLIADSFKADGFDVRVSGWDAYGEEVWDIYLISLPSIEKAGELARSLSESGWSPEITFLSDETLSENLK
ncbi:MAG: secretin N-terminal domain-containing protein [Myxococcota bacterium]|nr:secretin N-terminal domain-containing protein [Myxococcota bacterium]